MQEISLVDVFKWAWGFIVPYIFWLHKKIDNTVKREEYNGTIESIRQEIRDGNSAITERFDRIMGHLLLEKK